MARTALTNAQLSAAYGAIETLCKRMVATTPQPTITPSQFVDLFAPPEDRQILKLAPAMTSLSAYYLRTNVTVRKWPGLAVPTAVTLYLNEGTVLPPKGSRIQDDADPALLEAVAQWVTFYAGVVRDFGRAKKVLSILDDICKSPGQLRYVWPSIIALLKLSETGRALAEEITDLKLSKTQPTLPQELREACRLASATITSALLLDEPTDTPAKLPVSIQVDRISYHEDFGSFNALEP